MENSPKTGLGDSLLLRRTETPQAPGRPDVSALPDAQALADAPDQAAVSDVQPSSRPKRPAGSRGRKAQRLTLRDKVTLHLDRDVNDRLDLAARVEGKERSEVASEILRRHLPKYHIERE